MTEPALAIADLTIGVPGVVDIITKYADWLVERKPTRSKDAWTELASVGQRLKNGRFKTYVQEANEACTIPGLDPSLKDALADELKGLELDLNKAQVILSKAEPKSTTGKVFYNVACERKALEALELLRPHEEGLFNLIMLINKTKQSLDQNFMPDMDRLAINEEASCVPVAYAKRRLFITSATYKESSQQPAKKNLPVLIERQPESKPGDEEDLREITSRLCSKFGDKAQPGVLRCLGYQTTPEAGLIFELPEDAQAQTLQTLFMADLGKEHGGGHPLDYRLRLARQIAQAVLTVHAADFVHKNIRAETILVLRPAATPAHAADRHKMGFGDPHLTEWRLLREAPAAPSSSSSTRARASSHWWENIYRHPERQGLGKQDDYGMGHDVYSLGVCLLEVGLWDPLVRPRTASGHPEPSDLFKRAAGLPDFASPEDVRALFRNAAEVKRTLVAVARRYLPPRMGLAYTALVEACLKVLDKPSGLSPEIPDFSKLNDKEKGVAFKELILSSFPSLA